MLKLSDIRMKPKLIGILLLVGVLPLAVVSWTSTQQAQEALLNEAYSKLTGMREIKKTQISKYFQEREGDMGVLVDTVQNIRQATIDKLEAIQQSKRSQLESYFSERKADAVVLSTNNTVIEALGAINRSFDAKSGPKVPRLPSLQSLRYSFGYREGIAAQPRPAQANTAGQQCDSFVLHSHHTAAWQ